MTSGARWPVTAISGRSGAASRLSTTRAIIGLPSRPGISSLCCGLMRLLRPAASTMAAMLGGGGAASMLGGGGAALARGSGRAVTSFSSPPTPHAGDGRAVHVVAGEKAGEHPVDAVELGAAGTAGQHEGGAGADAAEADEVTGIDRHAEMADFTPGGDDACWPDVAAVHHGAGARDQQDIGAARDQFGQGSGDVRLGVRARDRREHGAAEPGNAVAGRLGGAGEDGGLEAGQPGHDEAHAAGLVGVQVQARVPRLRRWRHRGRGRARRRG